MSEVLAHLEQWLSDRQDLRRMFVLWIRATLMRKPEYGIVLPQLDGGHIIDHLAVQAWTDSLSTAQ